MADRRWSATTDDHQGIHARWILALAKDLMLNMQNVGPLVQGKKFTQLSPAIRKQIERYVLNFILLPKDLSLNMRSEIFRRINEGGVPLSAHDLRLASFGGSPRVSLI